MNKRIKKKHEWLGCKRAGANYCGNQIARHIGRKILYSGITPKPSYVLNVRRHVRWFFHHSSEEEWSKRVDEAYFPHQMFFSAKHLLPAKPDYTSFNGRYKPNPPIMKIEIKFSDRLKPDECDMLLHTDIIEHMLKMKGCFCRLYKTDICKDGIRGLINDPMKPMVFIKSFSKEDDKWFGEVEVPEPYRKYIPLMKTGYIHPVVMVDDDKPTGILYFEMRWINGHLSED